MVKNQMNLNLCVKISNCPVINNKKPRALSGNFPLQN